MNTNIKKRNKSLYKFSNTQKPKIIGNSLLNNIYFKNEIDNFQSTVSNITKQLNNMALGMISKSNNKTNNYLNNIKGKSSFILDILNTDKKELTNNSEQENKYKKILDYSYTNLKKEKYIISQNISFFYKGENNSNNLFNELELKQENENLKENIKFLLGQVKKYQKGGFSVEEIYNNEIEKNNEIKSIMIEKEKEIEKLKNNYQNEIKSILEKVSSLEIQYNNLKDKYNELKYKKNRDFRNDNIQNNINNEEIMKINNSEILENNNKNNIELNQKHPIFRNRKKLVYENSNLNFENSKNDEENYYPRNIEKKFTFHRTEHSNDYTNNLFFINNLKKGSFHKYNKSTQINNLIKYKNLKINNDKCLSLNNTMENSREKNNFKLIQKENCPKTSKDNNISFLYKKTPVKTEIINNNLMSYNDKSKIAKSASHNHININQKTNYQNFKKLYKNNYSKENNTIYPKLIRKLSSTLYRKKNNKVLMQNNKKIYNNNSYNNFKYYTREDESKNNMMIPTPSLSFSSVRFSKIEEQNKQERDIPLPKIDLSPVDLYYFPIIDILSESKSEKDSNNIVYNFNIDNMKFSTIEYYLEENSTFNLSYSASSNYCYDILLSITNGFFIITGEKTNYLYYYNKKTNYIYDLCKLNFAHNKGALLKINNDQIMCISGINSVDVEMYYIKDNICLNLPKMNCSHSESSYMIYNNNIIFSFFGYDYDKKKYINDIEFLILKNYYSENTWNNICINSNNNIFNLRNHSIFYRMNKENNNSKDIFIVGGYSNSGRNNGLIQIFIEEIQNDKYDFEFVINFKKYEENKVKIKGNNNFNINKYKNMDNLFLFSNEFNQFFDEENNLFYSYNYDNNFNIHIIDNFTLKHTIYRNKIKNN